MSRKKYVFDALEEDFPGALERWFDFLRIPSVSADPAFAEPCAEAARFMTAMLEDMGLEASLRETSGLPMVVAHHRARRADAPKVLFYGHYDVQPADPLAEWKSDPFEPLLVRGEDGGERVHARGACDDKGQLLTFIEALRACLSVYGELPFHLTVLLEGEEESGSPSLDAFLEANAGELRADIAFVCDTTRWDEDTPAITTRLRGLVHDEVVIEGPHADLHSGLYGGPVHNPAHVAARIIAGLWDEVGRVTLPGFYDGVRELDEATRRAWAGLGVDDAKLLAEVGMRPPAAGERGYTALEKLWARPTLEINGFGGGYGGEGSKTIIPARAFFKMSCRLVDDQDPLAIREAFRSHVRANLPAGVKASFAPDEEGGASTAVRVDENSPWVRLAAACLAEEWGREPVMMGCGASIPVVASFRDILGMDSLLVGFGLNDDAIHSPNEKYDLKSFRKGARSWARMLVELAEGSFAAGE